MTDPRNSVRLNLVHFAASPVAACGRTIPAQRFRTLRPEDVSCQKCKVIIAKRKVRHLLWQGGPLCSHNHARPASLTEDPKQVNCNNCLSAMEKRNRTGDW